MRRLLSRSSLAIALVALSLAPVGFAQAQRTHVGNGTVVTMYAGEWTPTGNTPDAAHPRVYHALQVLAQKFQQQTGIRISFVNPGFSPQNDPNGLVDETQYLQSHIAANTAPDIAAVGNIFTQAAYGWWANLDAYYNQPDPFVPDNKHWKDLWSSYVNKNLVLDPHGHHFYIPISGAYPGLLVGVMANDNLLRKAGVGTKVPSEWNDWLKQLAALKAKGYNAVAGEASHSGAQAASWPLWSELWAPYMGHVFHKVAPGADVKTTAATQIQIAKAVQSGVISLKDPMFQEVFRQMKKYMGYWISGWQTADVESLWTEGKLAERQAGIWDLVPELSDPNRHFKLSMSLPPIPTKKSDPRVLNPLGYLPTGQAARTARVGPGNGNVFGLITRSVTRDHNEAAAIKWLQYITAPAQDEYIVNEHPDNIPATLGTHMAPVYQSLNKVPIPDYGALGSTTPFGLSAEATPDMEKELAVWVAGRENDKTFFAHMQDIITTAAKTYIAGTK